jgi:hypothetical protein
MQRPLISGASYAKPENSNVIRTQFPGGVKARRRSTLTYQPFSCSIVVNRAGLQILHDFYWITLAQVLPFQWIEHRDPAQSPAVYVFLEEPTFTPRNSGMQWRADLRLEIRTPFNGTFVLADDLGRLLQDDDINVITT